MIDYHSSDTHLVTLRIDARAVNPLSRRFQQALEGALDRLDGAAAQLRGVVLRFDNAAPPGGHELEHLLALTPAQADDCMAMLAHYNALLRRLETLGRPVVAALAGPIHGHALGLALACPRRVALRGASLRLPEVTMGLTPSGGALVRMVRSIGLKAALPLLRDGLALDAAAALQAGLLHGVAADADALTALAHGAADAASAPPQPWDEPDYRMPGGAPGAAQLHMLLLTAPALLREQTGGLYPAPEAVLCAMVEGGGG
ncbi:enoyl-CoA hydratase/isomerase family protein, partial [Janthinobacterium sp.]|uniref:enoyl-CoA hydratase/isomerase family protein n=1 Tax=Janthinobacterium sp. TaxID=1871054 RepID=UPI00293D67A0